MLEQLPSETIKLGDNIELKCRDVVVRQLVDEETNRELDRRLNNSFATQVEISAPAPGIKTALLSSKMADFQAFALWFQDQATQRLLEV